MQCELAHDSNVGETVGYFPSMRQAAMRHHGIAGHPLGFDKIILGAWTDLTDFWIGRHWA